MSDVGSGEHGMKEEIGRGGYGMKEEMSLMLAAVNMV
jgi:hypothetical protein